ncbi:type I phosphomannose isomerase catalytic subunit [Gramella sp. KN1008]|uniref:type I phosphomannose isomerase catalytic subunit n=1 Tax=Gramella sp. KN1008 TaxID=2529298 RepID=UPI00103FD59D|nr:type I phosphomannose isomerase catalytic subunit [Gramella sp. KN1008]TBW28033.1 mannose-6-phosphate isomerase [Gramella sp. KN1008]
MILKKFNSYGIKFKPILKDKIWGGSKLKDLLGKHASSKAGESWEVSAVEGDISEVKNGEYKDWKFDDLLESFPNEILGKAVVAKFGGKFPLLIKFIDAAENLSVQVHPDDKMAKKEHNSFGKTEMWYVIQADEGANINVGWKNPISPQEYREGIEKGTITDYLNFIQVDEGDTFFIKAGKVHAIGAGVMLAEIQQTSDVTYRVYDWDRVDEKGNSRELHVDLAAQAMNFNVNDDHSVNYKAMPNQPANLVDCEFFKTNIIHIDGKFIKDCSLMDSFIILMCVGGHGKIAVDGKEDVIEYGESILVPAIAESIRIEGESLKLLEVSVPS